MVETLRLETLDLAIKRRDVITLRRLVTEYKIPEWHPCPCPSDSLSGYLDGAYLARLLESERKTLLPILVIGNYALTSTCLLLAAAKLGSEYLDNVIVEVWSLGDYSDDDKFAVMALTVELCRVHEDKGDREIKLEFAKELVKAYVIDVAVRYGPGQAMKVIEELAQGFHANELVKVFTRYIKAPRSTIHNYIRAVTLDRQFMDVLRQLVVENFGNQPNVESNTAQSPETQNISVIHSPTSRDWLNHADERTLPAHGMDAVLRFSMEAEGGLKRRLAIMRLRRIDEGINEELLKPLSANDLNALAKVVENLPPSDRKEYLGKVLSLVREGKIGEAKALIHGRARPKPTTEEQTQDVGKSMGEEEAITLMRGNFEFVCEEEVCSAIRGLSRASLRNDPKAMLEASLALASRLANTLGMGDYAKLLGAISRNISNARLMNLLLSITELAEENPSMAWAIADAIKAVREGDLRGLCTAFNDIINEATNNMPREVKESIKNKVRLVDCRQYPGPEDLGP